MQTSTRSVAWREEDEGVVVEVVQLIAPPALDLGVEATLTYTVTACGVSLSASGRTYGDYHDIIPRIGITFEAPGTGREVTWLGLGPGENYPDSRAAAVVGRWTSTVEDMQTPYVVPQDCANRGGVRWFALTDSRGTGLAVARTPGGGPGRAEARAGRTPRSRRPLLRSPAGANPRRGVRRKTSASRYGRGPVRTSTPRAIAPISSRERTSPSMSTTACSGSARTPGALRCSMPTGPDSRTSPSPSISSPSTAPMPAPTPEQPSRPAPSVSAARPRTPRSHYHRHRRCRPTR